LQEILGDHQGDGLPWERAEQAIASKKRDLSTQIAALQRMQTGLIALETQLKAQGQCSSMSKIAI
jgi:hypothetical protein